jgi:hypothetical protein
MAGRADVGEAYNTERRDKTQYPQKPEFSCFACNHLQRSSGYVLGNTNK